MRDGLLPQIDQVLTWAALRAERFASEGSWRVGTWAHARCTSVHETVLRACQRLGWLRASSAATELAQRFEPKALPAYARLAPADKQTGPTPDALLEEIWYLETGSTVRFSDLSWRSDPFGEGPSLARFQFHALDCVRVLNEAHTRTGRPAYLRRARETARRW